MKGYQKIKAVLKKTSNQSASAERFFKTGKGEYAEHDQFIGVPVPVLRKIAKEYEDLTLPEIILLLKSPINEERLLALIIKCNQYKKGSKEHKNKIFQNYLKHLKYINNWNLVDASAHLIVGAHLLEAKTKDKEILINLANSDLMWYRRIAIVSTWYFIRHHSFDWTNKIAKILIQDSHDLIHKAVGWMLREMGKKDLAVLLNFLDQHAAEMPRTMLRYSIEKLTLKQRKTYLGLM